MGVLVCGSVGVWRVAVLVHWCVGESVSVRMWMCWCIGVLVYGLYWCANGVDGCVGVRVSFSVGVCWCVGELVCG